MSETSYLRLLRQIMEEGDTNMDRTGVGTKSVFGAQMKFDLSKGFPLLTTKRVHLPAIIHELLWFLQGDTNIRYLQENHVRIWNEWADENGDLGPVYGKQWRDFGGVDQISELVEQLKTNPASRRMVVSAWNPPETSKMGLPPCHMFFQCRVNNGKLDLLMYQRSADMFLGVPFNIASYALLQQMLAQICGLGVGTFTHSIGDAHIYLNHFDQVAEQLSRIPRKLPMMVINSKPDSIFDFKYENFVLFGYEPHPTIKAPVAV